MSPWVSLGSGIYEPCFCLDKYGIVHYDDKYKQSQFFCYLAIISNTATIIVTVNNKICEWIIMIAEHLSVSNETLVTSL